jgi:hypothetical protein
MGPVGSGAELYPLADDLADQLAAVTQFRWADQHRAAADPRPVADLHHCLGPSAVIRVFPSPMRLPSPIETEAPPVAVMKMPGSTVFSEPRSQVLSSSHSITTPG